MSFFPAFQKIRKITQPISLINAKQKEDLSQEVAEQFVDTVLKSNTIDSRSQIDVEFREFYGISISNF
jgi:hypothetical protein